MRTEVELPADPNRRKFVKMAAGAIVGLAAGFVALELDPLGLLDEPIPPNFFSNKTDEGVMGDENSMILSPKKAWQEFPQGIEENQMGYTAKILFPFQAGTEIKYTAKTFNPSEVTGSQRVPWQDANIRWPRLFLPKDARVIAPFDANLHLIPNNQNFLDGISLIRYDSKTNTTYKLYIWNQIYTKDQFNAAPFLQNRNTPGSIDDWEKYPTVEKGTFLMTTFQEQTSVDIFVDAFRGKEIGPKADLVEKKRRALSTQFATLNDKLLVIGNT